MNSSLPHIGIFGRCNSGKSTLFNALLGQEASIVSPVSGTTTDVVRRNLEWPGLGAVVLIDTAGLDDNTPLGTPVEPVLPAVQTPADFTISRAAMPSVWDWPEQSPLRLETVDADGRRLSLVPYGCTKLRISAFAVK